MSGRVGLVDRGVSGFDSETSTLRHRVARVDRQVEQRILEFAGVGEGAPEPAGENGFDTDILAQRALQKL